AFPTDHINHAEGRDDVGNQVSLEHIAERGHAEKARRPHAHPVGSAAAVTDQVKTKFTIRPFHRHIDLAARDLHALDDQFEMVHQAFDVTVDFFLLWQSNAWIVYSHRAGGKLSECLLDDPHALFDLFKAHGEAIVVVPLRTGRHLKVHAL